MKKTGLEIVEMIAKGNAPKKIKNIEFNETFNWDECKKDYFDKCNDTLKILNNLDTEFEIIEETKVWKPKKGGTYYTIEANGIECYMFERDGWDSNYYDIGNCFRTEQVAEKYLEKIKIYVKLKRYAEEHNTEKIDWNNEEQSKYHMEIFNNNKINIWESIRVKHMNQVYFTSEELCWEAIKEIGEDNIKKLFEDE